jgi:hypothetical protein
LSSNELTSLSFAWWNTSLSPSAKPRATAEQQAIVCDVIRYFVDVEGIDFIALGEISEADVEYLKKHCNIDGYEISSGVSSIGRASFDTMYIYNTSKVFILKSSNIVSRKGDSSLKVAQKLDLVVKGEDSLFHLFISHWPSRLWCEKNSADRHLLGIRLRDEIDSLITEAESNPFFVLLGDYNDEPFDISLSDQLMATRDFELASRRKHLLYNPFWNFLSSNFNDDLSSGSYFYKSGKLTQWHTFDQIIFSHAFIKGNEWKLKTDYEHVVRVPGYLETVKDKKTIFDHLPVSGMIERVA